MRVKANWNGEYPCLCHGEWTLIVDGTDVSDLIPKELRCYEMNTFGTYERWYFNDNGFETFEDYHDGLECDDWIEANKDWLDLITEDHDTQVDIFYAISEHDFRAGSCGGCI